MAIDIDKIYAGLNYAETGSEKNQFIRTKVKNTPGGSTVFGPVQITGNLAQGALNNGYLKQSADFYQKEMKPRYERMNHSGNNKNKILDYNQRYDYGGDAEFDPKQHSQDYEMFAKEIISGVANEAGNDEKKFIEKWRGKKESDDPEYYAKVLEGMKKFKLYKGLSQDQSAIADEMTRQLDQ